MIFGQRSTTTSDRKEDKVEKEHKEKAKKDRRKSGKFASTFIHSLPQKLPTLQNFGVQESISSNDFNRKIRDTYRDDYNIFDLHLLILRKFKWEKSVRAPELLRLITAEEEKKSKPLTVVEREACNRRIASWKREYEEISSGSRHQEYMTHATPLLKSYTDLGPLERKIEFGNKKVTQMLADPLTSIDERIIIIEKYLQLAGSYLSLDIVREVDIRARCPGCGGDTEDVEITSQGLQCCRHCCSVRESVVKTPFFKDGNRVNNSLGNNYEDEANFYKAFLRFQGKHPVKLPENLMSDLDDYFDRLNLPRGEEIRKMPLKENGRRGKTDKEMMYTALADRGYAAHYEDINLICHLYWGWILPDISHLETQLMEDYRESQRVYEEIPKKRHSSLNSQYRLYRQLQKLGYPCSSVDFKMIKTTNIIDDYEDIWEQMCERLGWKYHELS